MVLVLQIQGVYPSALEMEEQQPGELPRTVESEVPCSNRTRKWTDPRHSTVSSSQENVCFTPGKSR